MPTAASHIRAVDIPIIDEMFGMGSGHVLNFSNHTFSESFVDLGVNIDDHRWAANGGSKAKRLRTYLRQASRQTALETLQALWDHREASGPVADYSSIREEALAKFFRIIRRLGGIPPTEGTPDVAHDPRRPDAAEAKDLPERLISISKMEPQPGGYAFEKFLNEVFDAYGLAARASFRLKGEQVDGSFVLGGETYLLEAKWTDVQVGCTTLRAFEGTVRDKAKWTRGLIVSQSGFTTSGLDRFGRGKSIVCMDGLDLHETLNRGLDLAEVIAAKVRWAGETGLAFVRVRDLRLMPPIA